ncbi:DUF2637 domain-containing protein [Streptomyces sp. CC224B]|uniref:DUF2637 domain-containing protein n=1 Tax=Streptomyces sp. CC224B TaxID=3044571 RepID=UPI0024A91214|nr:DUF2637 domain-containing protein [Streptomyces sp. CC224B]
MSSAEHRRPRTAGPPETEAVRSRGGTQRRAPQEEAGLHLWVRRLCALVVAGVAAYASYVHQREFALLGGADAASAALWPLSVDGLLLLSTVGLLARPAPAGTHRRGVLWLAFLLGIVVSLAANIAAAPALAWKPVLVAGWPPVALLLAVELLAHRPGQWTEVRALGDEANEDGEGGSDASDPLFEQALRLDARNWELRRRPISAEALRKELRIGASRSRKLVAMVRADPNG